MDKYETLTLKDALIEDNKLIAEKLATKVDKRLVEDAVNRYKVLSDNNFNDSYKSQLDTLDTDVQTAIDATINAINYADEANAKKYVSSVSQVGGEIVVTREDHLGGIILVEDDTEVRIKVQDPFYTRFLFSDKYGNLHYDGAIAGVKDRSFTLGTATQITSNVSKIVTSLPHSKTLILFEDTDGTSEDNRIEIRYDSATVTLFITKFENNAVSTQYSSGTRTWTNGVPALYISDRVISTINSTGFKISLILTGANFDDRIILTDADVTDVLDTTDHLPMSKTVKAYIDLLEAKVQWLSDRITAIENAHNMTSPVFQALDADGNVIEAMAIDNSGNTLDVTTDLNE